MSLRQIIAESNPDALFADGFDEAIIGVARRCGQPCVASYSVKKCIEILSKDMSLEEAVDFFEFNVIGAWYGEHTPVFVEEIEI